MQSRLTAGVTDLDTGLTDVDGDNFTHCRTRMRANGACQLGWQQYAAMSLLGGMGQRKRVDKDNARRARLAIKKGKRSD